MSFQLDTSGHVEAASGDIPWLTVWSDLSPFTQGYIEALFAERFQFGVGFSDLAPETLVRIIADCEAAISQGEDSAQNGAAFWAVRNHPMMPSGEWTRRFPPLTVHLGDDGKVRFTTPARSEERRAGE